MSKPLFYIIRHLICSIVFISCAHYCNAQEGKTTRIDSLLNRLEIEESDSAKVVIYSTLFSLHYRQDIQKAKTYLDLELSISKKLENEELISVAKNHEGIYYSRIRDNEKALSIFMDLKDYYIGKGNEKRTSSMYTNIANAELSLGNYKIALENQMKALEIDERLGERGVSLANNYFTLGNIHRLIENYKVSNEWIIKAKDEYNSVNAKVYVAQSDYTLGINYMNVDSFDLAVDYLEQSGEVFKDIGNKNAISMVLTALSTCSERQENYELASMYLEEAVALNLITGDVGLQTETNYKIARINSKVGDFNKAIDFGLKALDGAHQMKNRKFESQSLGILGDAYGNNNNFEQGYLYYKKYIDLKDSINKEDNLAALSELEIKYQTEKKQQEILLLEEKGRRSRIEKTALLGGVMSLLGLVGLLVYSMRQRTAKNKLIKQKLKQELEFSTRSLDLKRQELTGYAMQLASKNEMLEEIKSKVEKIQSDQDVKSSLRNITNTIHFNQTDDTTWEGFMERFKNVHKDFDSRILVNYPSITKNELRLMALLRLKLTSKEIASIQNISGEGVKKARYRLRKKLNLEPKASLEEFIFSI